jgi:predicted DNA-binding protein (MmcQ/YjbR family)
MNEAQIAEYVLSMPNAWFDYPFGEGTAVYKIGNNDGTDKLFAIIAEGTKPVQLSLKCDPELAVLLRDKYETILPGYHLNKKHWNTILCTGQVPEEELHDLIRHSFELVKN